MNICTHTHTHNTHVYCNIATELFHVSISVALLCSPAFLWNVIVTKSHSRYKLNISYVLICCDCHTAFSHSDRQITCIRELNTSRLVRTQWLEYFFPSPKCGLQTRDLDASQTVSVFSHSIYLWLNSTLNSPTGWAIYSQTDIVVFWVLSLILCVYICLLSQTFWARGSNTVSLTR